MKITLHFRHPQAWDRVAHIERTDTPARIAQAVISIAKEIRHSDKYSAVYADYSKWTERYNTTLDDWRKTTEERDELDRIINYYERMTYTVKELNDLTDEELRAIDDFEAYVLPSYLQERRSTAENTR